MSLPLFPVLLMIYEFFLYMSNDMYVPFFPLIASEFGVGDEVVSLTLSSWLLGGAIAQIALGPLSDRFGRRVVLIFGGILFMISCILCALSMSINLMMIARFLQGIGVCSMMIAGYACIHETYEDKKAIKILAMMSSISIVAPMIGPAIGGYLAMFYNWRIVFWILLLCSALSIMSLYVYMPDAQVSRAKYLGIKSILCGYVKLLQNGLFISSSLCFSMAYACIMLWISVSPFLIMQGYHMDSYGFGIAQLPVFGAFMLGTRITHHLINKLSLQKLLKCGFCVISLGLAHMAVSYCVDKVQLLISSMSVCMVGFGMLSAPLNRLAFNSAEGEKGITASVFYTCMMGLGAGVTQMFGCVEYTVSNFYIAFFMLAIAQMALCIIPQRMKNIKI